VVPLPNLEPPVALASQNASVVLRSATRSIEDFARMVEVFTLADEEAPCSDASGLCTVHDLVTRAHEEVVGHLNEVVRKLRSRDPREDARLEGRLTSSAVTGGAAGTIGKEAGIASRPWVPELPTGIALH